MTTTVILIRHAESYKNLKNIHGGVGESLTQNGIEQTDIYIKKLSEIGVCCDNSVIIYSHNVQARETAEIICSKLKMDNIVIPDYKPLYLGVVHGLSNIEVMEKYPEVNKSLNKWRNKEIEICDLKIPGMEEPLDFYKRGLNILKKIRKEKYNVLVATNSLYILLLNIFFGNTCEKGGGYKHFDIPNGGMSMFEEMSAGQFSLNRVYTDVQDVMDYSIN